MRNPIFLEKELALRRAQQTGRPPPSTAHHHRLPDKLKVMLQQAGAEAPITRVMTPSKAEERPGTASFGSGSFPRTQTSLPSVERHHKQRKGTHMLSAAQTEKEMVPGRTPLCS